MTTTADTTTDAPDAPKGWTIEDVLQSARLPEKRARVCLRADLAARHSDVLTDLSRLVDADGALLEESAFDDDAAALTERAVALNTERLHLEREMAEATWTVLFRGLSSDDLVAFNKQHFPKADKNGNLDLREYGTHLVAATAVEPTLTVEDVRNLRTRLGHAAFKALRDAAECLHPGRRRDPVALHSACRRLRLIRGHRRLTRPTLGR